MVYHIAWAGAFGLAGGGAWVELFERPLGIVAAEDFAVLVALHDTCAGAHALVCERGGREQQQEYHSEYFHSCIVPCPYSRHKIWWLPLTL